MLVHNLVALHKTIQTNNFLHTYKIYVQVTKVPTKLNEESKKLSYSAKIRPI